MLRPYKGLLSFLLAFSLFFADLSRALPPPSAIRLPQLPGLPSTTLLSTRLQLEAQRLLNRLPPTGPQAAAAQGSNPPFVHYWNYKTTTTPATLSNNGRATFYLKSEGILYVGVAQFGTGTSHGVTAIDFLTNTKIADYVTPYSVVAIHAAGGEVAVSTSSDGVYITDTRLNFIKKYTNPTLRHYGQKDVKLVKEGGHNLLLAGTIDGVSIVDRANADASYHYRFAGTSQNSLTGIDFDNTGATLQVYASYDNAGNGGRVARFPYRGNNHAVTNETLTYIGVVGGLHTYQAAKGQWTANPAPVITPSCCYLIDYTLGRVQYGAQHPTVTASYTFWNLTGVDNPGSFTPVDVWKSNSVPAISPDTLRDVLFHADSGAFYAANVSNPGTATRIKAGAATSYNATNNPGLQSASYYRLAKSGDDLFIATGLGVSRINEATGQVTVANSATTGNLNYVANDIAVDGPVTFTADNNYSSTMLYRGSATDGPLQLGRGTCDTRPLISNEVSACNGNASYSDTDLALPGKGMPLLFARSYNAQDSRQGPFGPGWTHSFDMALTFNPFSTVVMVRQGDGRRDKYQKNADGTYTGQAGVYDALVKNADLTYTLTQKDQTKFNFNASGRMTNVVDRNGNATTPAYDGDGKITTITDTAGRVITLAYNASAKVSSLTDNIGRVWTYAYNVDGRLASATNPLAGVTAYTYDSAARLLTVADPRGNVQLNNVYVGGMLTQQKDALNNPIAFSFATSPLSFNVTDRRGKTTTTFLDDLGRAKQVKDHLGNSQLFTYQGDTTLRATAKDKRGNTTSMSWDAKANLLSVTDPFGKVTSATYNASNFVTGVTDSLNRTTTFSYDANGNITGILDPLNRTWALAYNAAGQLTSITDPLSRVTSFGYDAAGNRTTITDALGKVTTFAYDGAGRQTSVTDPNGNITTTAYDALNRVTSATDALGRVTSYVYDGSGNVTSTTDALGRVTTAVYDARNFRTSTTNPLAGVTSFAYDANGNMTQATDPMGFAVSRAYDDLNRLSQITDQLGFITRFAYDADGNRTGVTRKDNAGAPEETVATFTYDANSRLTSAKDALNNTTSFAYDFTGNLTAATDPLSRATTYAYNAMAQLSSVTNALSQVSSYAYDAVGNLTTATDARNNTTTYAYTARNQLSSVTDPLNRATTFAYDNAGNRTSATDPLGNATTYVYDALNRVVEVKDPLLNTTVVGYDEVGNTTSVRDPLLNTTTYTYDALNRLTRTTDPPTNQTNLAYDANSRLTSVTDALTRVTTYAYNNRGQLTTTTNPLNQAWSRAYDPKGRLTSATDAKNQATTFAYDAADRLTSLTYVGQSAITYAYDAASALTSMVDSTGTTTYNRDALYRPTSIVTPDGLGGTKTVSYAYDAAGNRTGLTYPDAKQVTYAYDAADQLTGVTDWSAGAASLTYDNAGRPTQLNLPNGTRQTYTYDAASRVTGIAYRGPADAVIGDVGYGYDANSRRNSLTDSEGTTSFGYDTLNRLTSAAYPNGTTSYVYDAVGNRTSMATPSGTTAYTYDAADRLTQAGSTTYGYDANGNLTVRGADTFGWDSADRLTSATVAGTTATMAYDGSSNLVAKTVAGSTTRYVYDRNLPLPQLLTAGDTTYQYGPGMADGFGPMMQEAGGTKSWLHDDALGSIRFTTNSAGSSVGSSTYDAFGSQRATSGQQNLFRFTGQEQHSDLGLIHMRGRWYDPAIGRFISQDPVAGSATSPQSLNPYAYVRNNPCGLRDPSGLSPDGPSATSAGAASAGSAGAGLAVRLGLSNGLGGIPVGQAVFSASGASVCFVGEIYKAVWMWKDAPAFNDPGGDLSSRLAAYWTWVDALYKWSAEMLQMLRNPTFTKVGEVNVGCGGVGRATAGLLSQVPAHVGLGLDRAGQLVGSVPPEVWVGAAVGVGVAAVVVACATGIGCVPVIAATGIRTVALIAGARTLTVAAAIPGLTAALRLGSPGAQWSIVRYSDAQRITAGLGGLIQAHHLVEVRHLQRWGYTAQQIREAPSIIMSGTDHLLLTGHLRHALPYGQYYTKPRVWQEYQQIYPPEILRVITPYFQ